MTAESLEGWLDAYGRAWESRDPDAIAELFAEDALYLETPFEAPMRGRAAVVEYWQGVRRTQEDVHFRREILAIAGETGIAHWWASFVRVPSGKRIHLDGVAAVTLDPSGRCRLFREWWHRREA